MKEFHISLFGDKVVLTKDINRRGLPGFDYAVGDIVGAWKQRYIIEVGSKVVDIFGNVVTISEVLIHDETKTINYIVEENGNCYQPSELAGLYVRELTVEEFNKLTL